MPKSKKKQILAHSSHSRSRACSKCGKTFTAVGNWRKVKRVDNLLRLHLKKCEGKCRIPDAILDIITQRELTATKSCGQDERSLENYRTATPHAKNSAVNKVISTKSLIASAKGVTLDPQYIVEALRRAKINGNFEREAEAYKALLTASRKGSVKIDIDSKKGVVNIINPGYKAPDFVASNKECFKQ